jgi:hypothetical protein
MGVFIAEKYDARTILRLMFNLQAKGYCADEHQVFMNTMDYMTAKQL